MRGHFEDLLKEKLQDYSLKPEPRDWTTLQRSLGLDTEAPKRVPLYRYVATAAAVLILAVGCVYLLRIEPDAPIVPFTDTPVTGPAPLAAQKADRADEALDAVLTLKNAIDRSKERAAQLARAGAEPGATPAANGTEPAQTASSATQQPAARTNESTGAPANASPTPTAGGNRTAAGRTVTPPDDRLHRRSRRTPNSNWALALFADGMAGASGQKTGNDNIMQLSSANTSSSFMTITNSRGVMQVEQEGTGLYNVEVSDWKHALPLTFGFSVRKGLVGNWGIETGINYSYLSSKAELSSVEYRRQLHYLGVPLAVTYTPWRNSDFELYGRLGGAADFHVAGRQKATYLGGNNNVERKNFRINGVQWSLSANVGITYRLSPAVGLYFEPGVSHYFENSRQVDSYWKQHPTNFNMKIGVRTNF